MRLRCGVMCLLVGCGRIGFDPSSTTSAQDGAVSNDGAPAPLAAVGPVQVRSSTHFTLDSDLAWNGDGYAIVVETASGIDFFRVDASGTPRTAPVEITEGGGGVFPQVVFAGDEYGVAWRRSGSARFRPVAPDGGLLGGIYTSTATGLTTPPLRLDYAGGDYAIKFHYGVLGSNTTCFTRIDKATGFVAPESVTVGPAASLTDLRWSESQWLTVTRSDGADELWLRSVYDDWSQPSRLDVSSDQSEDAWLVPTGTGYAALWQDVQSTSRLLYYQPLAQDGTIETPAVLVTTQTGTLIIAAKRTPRGTEAWFSRGTSIDRLVLDEAGVIIDSATIAEPSPEPLYFDRVGSEFTFLWGDVNGLWLQRIESL